MFPMDEEEAGSSWLRRARFSKTVYCRHNRASSSDSILEAPASSKKSAPSHPPIEYDAKQRSPRSDFVSDSSGEAQAESGKKRSLKPHTRRTAGKVMAVETVDEYWVDLSQLQVGDRFARGAYSDLHHGRYKDEAVAVKIMAAAPDDDESITLKARLEKQFSREVALLSKLYHPNVIKLVGACRKPRCSYILTEYLSKGSLRSYLHKLELENQALPLKACVAMALDIARGMEYIHSQSVIHRDLKPENVLISGAFRMKIADFGIGCHEANCDSFADGPGTFRWMAPEMIKNQSYGRKVDVYSFGLILWEMVSGSIPYGNLSPYQAAYAAANKNERPAFTEDCPPVMRAIIEQCWSSEQEKRPEFCQLVRVLEQCESSLDVNGTLNLVQNFTFQDRNKGLFYWMQKLSPTHSSSAWNFKFC